MTGIFKAGPGIQINTRQSFVEGQSIDIHEIKFNGYDMYNNVPINILQTNTAKPGDVLIIGENGMAKWGKPFDDDTELRNQYPSLKNAWNNLMEALNEYEMVKKLVRDHE